MFQPSGWERACSQEPGSTLAPRNGQRQHPSNKKINTFYKTSPFCTFNLHQFSNQKGIGHEKITLLPCSAWRSRDDIRLLDFSHVNLRSQRPGFRSHIRGWALVSDGSHPKRQRGVDFVDFMTATSVDIISSGIEVNHKLY